MSEDIKVGDVADVIRRDVTITQVGANGYVAGRFGPGRTIGWEGGAVEFINVRHPEPPKPEHWPPQAGDMWADEVGIEWFISRQAGMMTRLEARTCTGILLRDDAAVGAAVGRRLSEGRLIHRKGDDPR